MRSGDCCGLNYENLEEISDVDPVRKIRLFGLNQLAKTFHSFVVMQPGIRKARRSSALTQEETLFIRRQLGEVGHDTDSIAGERFDQQGRHCYDVQTPIVVLKFIVLAGKEQGDERILSDIKEPCFKKVVLSQHPLGQR